MKASNLVTVWSAPDNSRLTARQYSFRLPVHVAAKLAALEEMYPSKSRTQLVGDLLSAAIAEMERSFPYVEGAVIDRHPETGEEIFEDIGPKSTYQEMANKHYDDIEKELGNDKPPRLSFS